MKTCSCDHTNLHMKDIRPGDTAAGEIHGAAYCLSCNGIITCDLCPPGDKKIAEVLTDKFYACWEHGDLAFQDPTD